MKKKTHKARSKTPRTSPADAIEQLAQARRALRHEDFNEAGISERIKLARYHALEIVLQGVDALKVQPEDRGISHYVTKLTGLEHLDYTGPDEDGGNAFRCLEAAFALGVATGLLLRPEAFQARAAR